MEKILLTGFEPFLTFNSNPTMEIVDRLNGKNINDYQIVGKVLPVDFKKSGKEIIRLIEEVKPEVVMALGLAGNRRHVTPERVAINCNDGPEDNLGYQPNGEKIIEDGPDAYFSTLPIKQMVKRMNDQGLPASISNTAGTYLCNHVMYQALHFSKHHEYPKRAGFIHIPPSHELAIQHPKSSSWSIEDLVRAVWLSLDTL